MRQWHLLVSPRRHVEKRRKKGRNETEGNKKYDFFFFLKKKETNNETSSGEKNLERRILRVSWGEVKHLGYLPTCIWYITSPEGNEKTKTKLNWMGKTKVWVWMYLVLVLLSAWDTCQNGSGPSTPFVCCVRSLLSWHWGFWAADSRVESGLAKGAEIFFFFFLFFLGLRFSLFLFVVVVLLCCCFYVC